VLFTPHLAKKMGDGLVRTLGLSGSADQAGAEVGAAGGGGLAEDPPVVS
jgi:hypothetical protein